jgi:hypothetical protein
MDMGPGSRGLYPGGVQQQESLGNVAGNGQVHMGDAQGGLGPGEVPCGELRLEISAEEVEALLHSNALNNNENTAAGSGMLQTRYF